MKPHILFVDDEKALCEILELYFRHNGLDVTTVATVSEAMDAVTQSRFHTVVLDLNLGEGDGLEVLRFVKDRFPELPVVIFTGLDADEHLVKKCYAGRADGFMRKTEGLKNLLTEIRRHLSTESLGAQ